LHLESRGVPLLMAGADLATCGLIGAVAVALRLAMAPLLPITLNAGQMASVSLTLMLMPVGYALIGLYPGYGLSPVERLRRQMWVGFGVFSAAIAIFAFYAGWQPSRVALLVGLILVMVTLPFTSSWVRGVLRRRGLWGRPVVVIGTTLLAERTIKRLQAAPGLGLVPVAVLSESMGEHPTGDKLSGVPIVGSVSKVKTWSNRTSLAIVAVPPHMSVRSAKLVSRLPFPEVILVPDLPDVASLCVSPRDIAGVLGMQIRKNLQVRRNWLIKRSFDYILAGMAAIATLPVILTMMLLIRLMSPGPAIFRQERVGLGGRRINVLKLRTMYVDADQRLAALLRSNPEARAEWENRCKLSRDPRIIPFIGNFLRRTSLDELPQIWNILRGEMSLVGPRPLPAYHLDKLPSEFRSLRRTVRPGMTGLWQVFDRDDGAEHRLVEHDGYYIRNWSMWLDVYILGITLVAVTRQRGAS